MRFLFIDQILELEPGHRIVTTKHVADTEGFLIAHYPCRPVMPPSIVMECLAQAGGCLNLASRDFQVKTLLVLVEGLRFHRTVQAGETLTMDVRMGRGHRDGATVSGEARVGTDVVATLERMVYVHVWTTDPAWLRGERRRVEQRLGRPLPPATGHHGVPPVVELPQR